MGRVLDLADGFTASSAPSTETNFTVNGSLGAPTTSDGLTSIPVSGVFYEILFLASDSGQVDVSASPQIAAGSSDGDQLVIIGASATNTLILNDGDGLSLNGSIEIKLNTILMLIWDGSNWVEQSRTA